MSVRRFRFVREAARAQWYLGLRIYVPMVLVTLGYAFLVRTQGAWILCTLGVSFWAWKFWKERRYEVDFWKSKRDMVVWLNEGSLWVSRSDQSQPESERLDWVHAIDALVEKGEVVRLLVDDREGRRTIYAGLHDMEAFAAEFRRNAPQARFRRVRLGFPMRLKEV